MILKLNERNLSSPLCENGQRPLNATEYDRLKNERNCGLSALQNYNTITNNRSKNSPLADRSGANTWFHVDRADQLGLPSLARQHEHRR